MSKELKDFSQKQLGQIALDLVRGLVSRDRIMNETQLAESDICLLESILRNCAYKLFTPEELSSHDRMAMPFRVRTKEENALEMRIIGERRKVNCKYVPKSVPLDIYYKEKISGLSSVIIHSNTDICYFLRRYEDWIDASSGFHLDNGNIEVAFFISINVCRSLPEFLSRKDVGPHFTNKKMRLLKMIETNVRTLARASSELSRTDEASQIIEAANNELCDLPIFAGAQLLYI